VNKKLSIIHLNGQPYDAATGQPLQTPVSREAGIAAKKSKAAPTTSATLRGPVMDIARRPVNHLHTRTPQHARTLMRATVPKPGATLKRRVKAQGSVQISRVQSAPTPQLVKHSVSLVDSDRQSRAEQVVKSQQVQHFTASDAVSQQPDASYMTPRPVQTAPAPPAVDPVAAPHKPSMDIFEQALHHATAHEQPLFQPPKRRHSVSKRAVGSLTAIIGLLLIGGFLTYRNVPTINLHLASARAGFTASLPAYEPAGFSVGKFVASRGKVAVHFQSNSDQRNYTVTERTSGWDSTTLRDSYVISQAGQSYETISSGGNTIYVYGQNNATWVNSGVWYVVQSNGALSTKQLIELAASL
jgi:hypothetical protein